jgi:aryl-alcohol dehydrogenase-like predicted oxidoreductase
MGTNFVNDFYSQDETSEMIIGEWMEKRGNRDQMVIATKVCGFKSVKF